MRRPLDESSRVKAPTLEKARLRVSPIDRVSLPMHFRRSIHDIALQKRDFKPLRLQLVNIGRQGTSLLVGTPYTRKYSAKLTALSSTSNRVSTGAPSA